MISGNKCEGKISLCKSCNDNNTCFKCVNNADMDLKTKECKCKLGYEYNKDSDSCKSISFLNKGKNVKSN